MKMQKKNEKRKKKKNIECRTNKNRSWFHPDPLLDGFAGFSREKAAVASLGRCDIAYTEFNVLRSMCLMQIGFSSAITQVC